MAAHVVARALYAPTYLQPQIPQMTQIQRRIGQLLLNLARRERR
jgi:hypothetical protein